MTRTFVIVCPTEYGGQIEHAADLGLALVDGSADSVMIITRVGAAEYIGERPEIRFQVVEVLPGRRTWTGIRRWLRAPAQVIDLVREHITIRRVVRKIEGNVTLVLDTSRYPNIRLLTGAGNAVRSVLFVHNVRPHFQVAKASLRQRLLLRLEDSSSRNVEKLIVHGEAQRALLSTTLNREIFSVPLPITSRLQASQGEIPSELAPTGPFALCLGELRRNKGVETAIRASGESGFSLVVAGAPEDDEYRAEIQSLARTAPNAVVVDRFLTRGEFDALLAACSVLVLPYIHFDAQSGPLAKAIALRKPVVASDLRSLRDQAKGFNLCEFVPVDDSQELATAIERAIESGRHALTDVPSGYDDWAVVANAVRS